MGARKRTGTVGQTLDKVSEVTRPDGSTNRVSDGLYVLDVPGLFVVDGVEIDVKAPAAETTAEPDPAE